MVEGTTKSVISRSQGAGGFPSLVLEHSSGYRLSISEYGAQVLSWVHPSERELLFLSPTAVFEPGKAIRGGIPIVFPQFGKGELPSHGFARTKRWKVVREQVRQDGPIAVGLRLQSDGSTESIWPHPFALELDVELSETLLMVLKVINTGSQPFSFNSALHTYFAVGDLSKCALTGLRGVSYVDFLADRARLQEDAAELQIHEPTDRAYVRSPEALALHDRDRLCTFKITKHGFADTVVWNPGEAGSASLSDLPAGAWRSMLCVESGNVESSVTVLPGETHASAQILRAEVQE
jgi:glucose-6-phosphate 1-epimerase